MSEATESAFTSAMLSLLDLEFGADDEGVPVPVASRLSPAAQRRFVAFVNRHGAEALERDGDEAAAWSKLEGYAARLALVFALFEDSGAVEVSDEHLAHAIDLVEWFGHEAARFYRGARETDEEWRLTPTATKSRREFVLVDSSEPRASTSTDSPESRTLGENVDVDTGADAETETPDSQGEGDADGWEAA